MNSTELFTVINSVESTNEHAKEMIKTGGVLPGMAWMALEQLKGKGQRGKRWLSAPGENITMTIAIPPCKIYLQNKFLLVASIANNCLDFLNSFTGPDVKIKWPNDLYWKNKKMGGILIENIISENEWKWAIIGIGLNVNETGFRNLNATSLKEITGQHYDIKILAQELHSLILQNLAGEDSKIIINSYNHNLYKKNEEVELKKGNAVFKTIIKEVNMFGQLLTVDTLERAFEFGEVEWRI